MYRRLTQVGRQLRHKLIEAPVAGVRDLVWRGCAWYIQVNMIKGHTLGREPDGPFDQIRRTVMSEGDRQSPPDNRRLATAILLLTDQTESLDTEVREFRAETAQRFDKIDQRFDRLETRMDAWFEKVWGELNNPRGERLEDLVRSGLNVALDIYGQTRNLRMANLGLTLIWSDRMLRELRATEWSAKWHRVREGLGIKNPDSSLLRCDFLFGWTIVDRGRTHRILFVGEVSTDPKLKRQEKLASHCADLERACARKAPDGPTAFVPILAGLPHRVHVQPANLVDVQIEETDFDENMLAAGVFADLPDVLDRLLARQE